MAQKSFASVLGSQKKSVGEEGGVQGQCLLCVSEFLLSRRGFGNVGRPLDLGIPKNLSARLMALEGIKGTLVLSWGKKCMVFETLFLLLLFGARGRF